MPAFQFITDAQLLTAIESLLKRLRGSTSFDAPYWSLIASQGNAAAANEIMRQMSGRGYLAAQIAVWDSGAEFEMDLGLFWAPTKGGAGHNYDNKFILPLDRRKELATVIYTTGGVYQDPKGPPLSFGYGEFDGSDDMFGVPINPYDPRIGRPMRF